MHKQPEALNYEIIRIERKPIRDYPCVPWFTISQCRGRDGRIFTTSGFAVHLTGTFKRIAEELLQRGIQSGQRGVVKLIPANRYQIGGYYTFYAN